MLNFNNPDSKEKTNVSNSTLQALTDTAETEQMVTDFKLSLFTTES